MSVWEAEKAVNRCSEFKIPPMADRNLAINVGIPDGLESGAVLYPGIVCSDTLK